jgi:hypothetical protein
MWRAGERTQAVGPRERRSDAAAGERTQATNGRRHRPGSSAESGERTQATTGRQGGPRSPEPGGRAQGSDRAAGERTQALDRPRGERTTERTGTTGTTPTADEAAVEATTRVKRIDETLTRLTAAHAGLTLGATRDDPAAAPDDAPVKRRPNLLRVAAVAVTALIVIAAGVGWGAQRWLAAAVPSAAALDPGSGAIVDASAQAGDENVLLVATDRATTPGATARPDTVAVAHIPAGGGAMTVLAIPADLEVARPPCERFDAATITYTSDTVPAQARTQLASALDLGGPRCATRAVQQLTGLAITRYVGLDLARSATPSTRSPACGSARRGRWSTRARPRRPDAGHGQPSTRAGHRLRPGRVVAGDPDGGRGRIERQQQVLAAVPPLGCPVSGLLDLRRVAALRPALGHALTTDAADLDQVLALRARMRDLRRHGRDLHRRPHRPRPRGPGVRACVAGRRRPPSSTRCAPTPALPAAATGAAAGPRPSDLTVQVAERLGPPRPSPPKIADTLRGLGFGIGDVTNAAPAHARRPSSATPPTRRPPRNSSPRPFPAADDRAGSRAPPVCCSSCSAGSFDGVVRRRHYRVPRIDRTRTRGPPVTAVPCS